MLSRIASIVLLLPLAGCLHPLEFAPVELAGPRRSGGASLPDQLGVVELADLRPRVQRRGTSPWLIPLIVWNQRIGRYVTSSEDLGGRVSLDVSRALAEALSGPRFGRGRVIEPIEGGDVAAYCERAGLRYLATGEIRHLYGAVRQRSWVFLPLPFGIFMGNQVGEPVGVARVSLRVLDCEDGAPLIAEQLVSEGVYQRASASEAAQQAFDGVLQQVADLSRVPGAGDGSAVAERVPPGPPAPPAPEETAPRERRSAPPEDGSGDAGEPELVPL